MKNRDAFSYEDFIEAVERMREAQKNYFAARGSTALREAKRLEKQVDRMIEAQQERLAERAQSVKIQPEFV
jgi:hypothetical protein